jgi:hypothetical protein
MRILFCADPLSPRRVDEAFAPEAEAARAAGWDVGLVSHEALTRGEPLPRALVDVPPARAPETAVYRGWMLRPAHYRRLDEALRERGLSLVNPPEAYTHAHHLPASYDVVRDWTPRTVWTREVGPGAEDTWMRLLAPFGEGPVLVKDFVKSRKHEWAEACFIPSASDRQAVSRVVRRFLELQGEDLEEGLVFREYVEFVPLAGHPLSGMPRVREFRTFVLDGKPLLEVPYWDDVDRVDAGPALDGFAGLFRQVRSRFFTADLAQRRSDGAWMLVELGDGQVSGLPERADRPAFFATLKARLEETRGLSAS